MPSEAEWNRVPRWRQGRVLTGSVTQELIEKSIDFIRPAKIGHCSLVVISQDCDLVREPGVEPYVELLLCHEVTSPQPQFLHGRNPRRLQFQVVGSSGEELWMDASVHDRFRIEKERLENTGADGIQIQLDAQRLRILRHWLAKRYTRPAFPDAFNLRLEGARKRLETLFKSPDSKAVTGIYLDLSDQELPDDKPYEIGVRITAFAESWDDTDSRASLINFESRLVEILEDCSGLEIADDDISTLPEEDLSVAELRRFKRLDRDYRSLPEDNHAALPISPDREP